MRKSLGVGLLALVAMVAIPLLGQAHAFSLLGGYTGPVEFHLTGRDTAALYTGISVGGSCATAAACDSVTIPAGTPIFGGTAGPTGPSFVAFEDAWGIFRVTEISTPGGGTTLWSNGDNGDHLAGIFYNVLDHIVTQTGSTTQDIRSIGVGGAEGTQIRVQLYDIAANAVLGAPSARTAAGAYPGVTGTAAQLFLDVLLVTGGAVTGDPVTELASTFDTSTTSGVSVAFGDIVGGFGAAMFGGGLGLIPTNNAGSGLFADLRMNFDTAPIQSIATLGPDCTGSLATCAQWTVKFNDPVEAMAIPQPSSLLLLGASLMSLGGVGYLRRKRG